MMFCDLSHVFSSLIHKMCDLSHLLVEAITQLGYACLDLIELTALLPSVSLYNMHVDGRSKCKGIDMIIVRLFFMNRKNEQDQLPLFLSSLLISPEWEKILLVYDTYFV